MRRGSAFTALAVIFALSPAHQPFAAAPQQVTPPKARYYVDAGTQTGLPAGKMGMGSAMRMAFGGGSNKEYKSLFLSLGSTLAASGKPQADHFMPGGMKLGKSVPLQTPETYREPGEGLDDFERPKGRLLIYWGCGGTARKGQPIIIDFAKIAVGQMPPNLWTVRVPRDRRPTPATSKTYGEWPHGKTNKSPSSSSSLMGDHRIVGNYLPGDINFSPAQDFMAGLNLRTSSVMGATTLNWEGLTNATGYYAWTMGTDGREGGDMIWWSSSEAREFGGGLVDYLAPSTVTSLIKQGVVMAPTKTSCTIPAEVQKAAAFNFVSLYAYGPEQNFIHPERPADPKIPWVQEWSVKLRYRSVAFSLLGTGMGAQSSAQCENKGPSVGGVVGGALGGILGGKKKDDCK
jgi:hypothetical protein